MKFPQLTPAIFIKRDNRFSASVRLLTGEKAAAYVPTTGRLTGALRPGCRAWLVPSSNPKRKTRYTMVLTELGSGGLCSVNAAMANELVGEALRDGKLDAFQYGRVEREVTFGRSRLDFHLLQEDEACWIEVKSVTYAEEGVGKFPDAPTARGRKHLGELAKLAARGERASAIFVAQREDALRFVPFEAVDPEFSETLREVHRAGVEVHAYRCDVSLEKIEIAEEIPVDL